MRIGCFADRKWAYEIFERISSDERFEIVFHGDGPQLNEYKAFCEQNGFNNAVFTGSYNNADKAKLLCEAGILNNCYGYLGSDSNKVQYAVSNRFYDGMIFRIPQVVEPEGYKTGWAREAGVGVSFLPDADFADKLYDYYTSLDADKFNAACAAAMQTVIREDDEYIAKIDSFIT